jgi:hypothetical protein
VGLLQLFGASRCSLDHDTVPLYRGRAMPSWYLKKRKELGVCCPRPGVRVPVFWSLCPQLVTYEFAVLGLWVYGGVLSGYLLYTNQDGSDANFDTITKSLLSMFQACREWEGGEVLRGTEGVCEGRGGGSASLRQ